MNKILRNKLLLGLILIALIGMGLVTARRAANGSNDFDTFYNAGRSALLGKSLYYTGEFYRDDHSLGSFLYPPFAAILFVPLALIPIKIAAFLWHILSLGLFVISLKLCEQLMGASILSSFSEKEGRGKCDFTHWPQITAMIVCAFFLFALLLDNLTMAQANLPVLFLTLAALYINSKKRAFLGGVVLASAIAIKVTPLIFAPYFLAKRQWRAFAGCIVGIVMFFVLIPSLFLGWNQNILLHRQWAGKSFKPALISFYNRLCPEAPHPFKKSIKEWRTADLYNLLTPKNQSFSAVTVRWCLKDRNLLAYSTPIYVAQRYLKLPILGGGLPYETLKTVLSFVQASLLLFAFALFTRRRGDPDRLQNLEFGLLFLSMTLFSPLARSHQFIYWMFSILLLANSTSSSESQSMKARPKALSFVLFLAFTLYSLQAIPYGKAIGLGMFSNLSLWITFAILLVAQRAPLRVDGFQKQQGQ